MNSPFVIEQACNLVKREEVTRARNDGEKIQAIHRLVLLRPANSLELELAEKFITLQPGALATLSPIEKYSQVLLLSNDLMFVD